MRATAMRPVDSKPSPWFIWTAIAFIPLVLLAGWIFGETGAIVLSGVGLVAYLIIDSVPIRAPTGQDHMTKNPGRGS
ncbi:MAG: hypothetical protein JNK78_04395 [Planctomycetes bacterium]|nr:hypothetical protein [Planctomycetota bacterium]